MVSTKARSDDNRILSVTDILSAPDIEERTVFVPQWGGSLKIRSFTKERQQELRRMATDPRTGKVDSEKLELQMFIHGVVEPQFEPIQATELRQKSAGAMDLVLRELLALSGLTPEAAKSGADEATDGL